MLSKKKTLFLFQPLPASLFSSAAFFAVIFLLFRPGYAVNDDISIISLASGYWAGSPLPYLVYSNVLLGLILNLFYGFNPNINWEILLFIAINFISVWALTYTFLSRLPVSSLRAFATIAVFLCDTYFVINITYTMIAAFAALAGFVLVLAAVQSPTTLNTRTFLFGVALLLAASLIRLKAMLLIGVLILPVLVFFYHSSHLKKYLLAVAVLGILISSLTLFDRLYIQASPDWHTFQIYDVTRSQLHDTPRKINADPAFAPPGWSKNDLKLFFAWFFPDKQIYSLQNLQYLVEHVPGTQKSKVDTLTTLSSRLFSPISAPYVLIIFSTWLILFLYKLEKKTLYPLITLALVFFALSFYLAWAAKIPDRILISLLTATAIFGLYTLLWSTTSGAELPFQPRRSLATSILRFIGFLIIAVTAGLVLNQSINTTKINITQQAAYQKILVDLKDLQDHGKINTPALIISPAYGFPFEWANPLTLNLPDTQVLEMGWLTFSPAYQQLLRKWDIQSIPEALYEKNNVYLMTPLTSLSGILDFIKEHKGLDIDVITLYQIPGTGIQLYQLQQKK